MEERKIISSDPSKSLMATPNSSSSFEEIAAGKESLSPASLSPGFLNRISDDWFEIQKHQILRKLQETINRYNDCFRSLQQMTADVNLLREENLELKSVYLELSLLLDEKENSLMPPLVTDFGSPSLESLVDRVQLGKENVPSAAGGVAKFTAGGKTGKRAAMPKSISIRSSGFLVVKNPAGGSPGDSSGAGSSGETSLPHRLILPVSGQGDGEEEAGTGALEVDVYDQGMAKTELCNKWEEMSWCPYGDQCQFAHGMQELRPVIRHPRYKTQLCRMLGAPGGCPYGHRCHFRHALAEQGN